MADISTTARGKSDKSVFPTALELAAKHLTTYYCCYPLLNYTKIIFIYTS